MNAAQIKKLQNKIGKKVDANIKAREDEFNRTMSINKAEMRDNIKELQHTFPDRGICFVLFNGSFYHLDKGNNYVQFIRISQEDRLGLDEPIREHNGKKYYFIKKSVKDFNEKIIKFMEKHYADIKILSCSGEVSIEKAYAMGNVFSEFQKEFEGFNMIDFIRMYKAFDNAVIKSIM